MRIAEPPWLSTVRANPRGAIGGRKARITAAMLALTAVAGIGGIAWTKLTGLPDDAAFRVEDEVVTEDVLHDRVELIESLYGVREPADPARADAFRRDSAKAVAVAVILDRAARERGIVIADRAVRDSLAKMIAEQFGGDRGAFIGLLGKVGVSEEDVLSELRRQQVIATLEEEVTRSAPPVTEADVRRAFDERRATLASPERRHLRNLVVTTRAEADTVLRRVRAGADLGALAKQASLDESTRTKGGDLGFVTRDNLEQQYADVAFRTPRGEFFGPIKTRFGWNIGEVLNIERSQPRTFSVVKNDLRAALLSERRLRHWRDWLAEEIRDADVEYSDRYRPADPGAAPGSSSDDQSQQPPSPR